MKSFDASQQFKEIVLKAKAEATAINIQGGGSKQFYGRQAQGQSLDVTQHQGIINYQPTELVLTARAGTRIKDIQALLAEQGQMLAFEPADFDGKATLGGAIAWGQSGPRRPFSGAVRDFVLGCRIINGHGEVLRFGGEVMKNVAGYDISRLMVGAMGTLGLLLDISIKVLPVPEIEKTLFFELSANDAIVKMNAFSGQCLPISGMCFDGTRLFVRFSGLENSVIGAVNKLGGEKLSDCSRFWNEIREYRHPFFQQKRDIWRLSVPPATPVLPLKGLVFYDWGGALRWLSTDQIPEDVFSAAVDNDGHALLFRSDKSTSTKFQPLPEGLQQLHYRLKQAFDPDAIFNPFRLHEAW